MKKLVDTLNTDLLPAGYGYNKRYRYQINLQTFGVGYNVVQWCLKNCKSKWGWYFITKSNVEWADDYKNMDCILTFKSKQDAVYFKLTHA